MTRKVGIQMSKERNKKSHKKHSNKSVQKSSSQLEHKLQKAEKYSVLESTTLLPFLLENIKGKGRNAIKAILSRGQVMVDGVVETKHNYMLTPNQVVSIQSNQAAIQEDGLMGIEILFEDDDLIVINKDAGILSVATDNGIEPTAHRQLMHYVKEENPKNRIYVVHRLDRDTSGVMIFAKNEKTKRALQDNWKELVDERVYTAVVEGDLKKDHGTIKSWLKETKSFKVYSNETDNGGKIAITHYKKRRSNGQYSMLEVRLDTGRKNQIRVHMEDIGHPIVGDKKYSAKTNPLKRLGLHATTITFTHPTTKEKLTFKTTVPRSFINTTKQKNK
ncbi:RluA family pseudouridine synthase [Vagococcus jeotgali]|uniref:RluA family pseudouridine synthase n=1 Tax=Vagococcus jeotgali TaxID=3109030 RepID=UPI002DDA8A38|nr:RluA family pseudouridine synthase [Vagococcus sp. B2T-5]